MADLTMAMSGILLENFEAHLPGGHLPICQSGAAVCCEHVLQSATVYTESCTGESTGRVHNSCADNSCTKQALCFMVLQSSSDMHQMDNLQTARRATTPGVSGSVALLHILQVVQVRTDLQCTFKTCLPGSAAMC